MSAPQQPPQAPPSPGVPLNAHSTRVDVINTAGGRILCVADVRGALSTLNKLAAEHSAVAIIHSGDFGFYEPSSLPNISERTLRHLVQYSSLISPAFRSQLLSALAQQQRDLLTNPPKSAGLGSSFGLSEFPKLLSGELKFNVPVYTVWGACEDVAILEKIRLAAPSEIIVPKDPSQLPPTKAPVPSPGYSIPNLTVLDEATTRCLEIGGIRLRLFGLGGAVVSHKLFDNGTGAATIAGGGGTMWTTVLQVGELIDTAQKVYDPSETRLLVSHASPGREGLLTQLALVLKADLTVSAGLHFRYGVSYNEFSVQHDPEGFRAKLEFAKKGFNEIWESVRSQVENVVDERQGALLKNALAVANRTPAVPVAGGNPIEESAWKNCWNWNLPDAAFGSLILDIRDGKIGSELKSQGFNFAYRQNAKLQQGPPAPSTSVPIKPAAPSPAPRIATPASTAASETKPVPIPSPTPSPAPVPTATTPVPRQNATPSSFPNNLPGQPQGQHGRNASGNHPNARNGAPRGNGFTPGARGGGGHGRGGWNSQGSLSGGEGRPPREPRGDRGVGKKSSDPPAAKDESVEAKSPAAPSTDSASASATTEAGAATPAKPATEGGDSGSSSNGPSKHQNARQLRQQAQRNASAANLAGKDAAPKEGESAVKEKEKDTGDESAGGGAITAGESSGGDNPRSPSERGRGRGRGGSRGGRGGGRGGGEMRGGGRPRGGKTEGGDSAPSTPTGDAPKLPASSGNRQGAAGQPDKARDW